MKTIWKFELDTTDFQRIAMPKGATLLYVAVQRDTPCIWAEVDPEAKQFERSFAIYGTGHPMQAINRNYIGSYMLHGGALVFHVFELT